MTSFPLPCCRNPAQMAASHGLDSKCWARVVRGVLRFTASTLDPVALQLTLMRGTLPGQCRVGCGARLSGDVVRRKQGKFVALGRTANQNA